MCPVHDPNLPPAGFVAAPVNMPSSSPARKVVGASAGAGLGGVTAGIIVWALGASVFNGDVPAEVSAFVITLVPLALSFVGGYVTRRGAGEVVVPAPPAPLAAPVAAKKAAPVKKAPAKKAAKKAAPKPPTGGLS